MCRSGLTCGHPRKPWDTGNEYHTIAFGICSIIFHMAGDGGRKRASPRPKDLGRMEFEPLIGPWCRLSRISSRVKSRVPTRRPNWRCVSGVAILLIVLKFDDSTTLANAIDLVPFAFFNHIGFLKKNYEQALI
jgi:hypothetical protein